MSHRLGKIVTRNWVLCGRTLAFENGTNPRESSCESDLFYAFENEGEAYSLQIRSEVEMLIGEKLAIDLAAGHRTSRTHAKQLSKLSSADRLGSRMKEVTQILSRVNAGDARAADELLTLIYRQLRRLAAARLNAENPNITLQVTELVSEAYLRLLGQDRPQTWHDRSHFFGAASEAMRRILVDHARRKQSLKRGGAVQKLQLNESFVADQNKSDEILAVHEALDELQAHDAEAAKLVKLRYFVGMRHAEVAQVMGISKRSADRLWLIARTWLYRRLDKDR